MNRKQMVDLSATISVIALNINTVKISVRVKTFLDWI
jgi:hypothetical protein